MILNVEDWLWKSNFGTFWHLPVSQFAKFSFDFSYFLAKNLLVLYPSLENSITSIAIMSKMDGPLEFGID